MKVTTRRAAVVGLLAFVLSSCAAPLVEESLQQQIVVRSISVNVDQYEKIKGRNLTVSPERLKADMEAALRLQLEATPAGNTNVVVQVTDVRLVSPGEAAMLGSNSQIGATISATNSKGTVILAPTEVAASSEKVRFGGLIGAMMTPKADDDYRFTVSGFAKAVRERLLGKKPLDVVSN